MGSPTALPTTPIWAKGSRGAQQPRRSASSRKSAATTSKAFASSIGAAAFAVRTAEDRDWVDRRCTDHPLAAFEQPITLSGAGKAILDRSYVFASGYRPSTFRPLADRLRDDPAWDFHDFDCGHEVIVDMPQEHSTILLEVARRTSL